MTYRWRVKMVNFFPDYKSGGKDYWYDKFTTNFKDLKKFKKRLNKHITNTYNNPSIGIGEIKLENSS